MQVAQLMTPSPKFVSPETPVREALATLDEFDIRHLPVIDASGMLLSIVSDRDLRPVMDLDADLTERLLGLSVGDVLRRLAMAVQPETAVAEAARVMIDERVGAVPVVDEDSGALVGILSYVDLLEHAFGSEA
ncbi:MAG: CBS domain-containing protein [Myxococcales bacterium]|nr:CBS domain-containing protein [Myxococcales bacterium]